MWVTWTKPGKTNRCTFMIFFTVLQVPHSSFDFGAIAHEPHAHSKHHGIYMVSGGGGEVRETYRRSKKHFINSQFASWRQFAYRFACGGTEFKLIRNGAFPTVSFRFLRP